MSSSLKTYVSSFSNKLIGGFIMIPGGGSFLLFDVSPHTGDKWMGTQCWNTQEIVSLLAPHFSGPFYVRGFAGVQGSQVGVAVISLVVTSSRQVEDNSSYFFKFGGPRIFKIKNRELPKRSFLHGFACSALLHTFAPFAKWNLQSDMSASEIADLAKQHFGFGSHYAAFVLELFGECTVSVPDAQVQCSGLSMYGVATPDGSHFCGSQIASDVGGELVKVSGSVGHRSGAELGIWGYEPNASEILEVRY